MNNGVEHQRGGLSRFCNETSEWNALICSVAFFLIFSAFGTVQNEATSAHGDDGSISLAILYIVLTFSNIFMPLIASYITPRWAMFLGSATYAMYVAANIHEVRWILFLAAGIMGFGAALLWVAQGAFITKCSHEYEDKYGLQRNSQLGYYNGLFWAWMVLNQFVGNGIAALLVSPYLKIGLTTVYIVFTSINIAGVCVFLFIKPFDSDRSKSHSQSSHQNGNDNQSVQSHSDYQNISIQQQQQQQQMANEQDLSAQRGEHHDPSENGTGRKVRGNTKTTMSEIETIPFIGDHGNAEAEKAPVVNPMSMINLWKKKQQLLLIPFTLYSGISQAFEYGNFPGQINDNFHKFVSLSVFGLVNAICSLLFGRMSDKIGRLPVLTIAFIAHGTVYIYFFIYSTVFEGDWTKSASDIDKLQNENWYDFIIVAVFLGIGDAGFNTQMYALYGSLLGEKSEVFANLKFWQSIAMTWGFLSSGVHEGWNIVLISCFTLLIAAALPLYLSAEVRKKSRPQRDHHLTF